MTLSDSLAAQGRKQQGPRCTVCNAMKRLSTTDRDALLHALDDPFVQSSQISRALKNEGLDIGPYTVARHRRGECRGPQ